MAGHDVSPKLGQFCVIPQDHDGGPHPVHLADRAIGQDVFQNGLAKINAKHALILLDACKSGALG